MNENDDIVAIRTALRTIAFKCYALSDAEPVDEKRLAIILGWLWNADAFINKVTEEMS